MEPHPRARVSSMRVLVLHNFYRSENASGENLSVVDEVDGLRSLGWEVEFLRSDSDVIGRGIIPLGELALRPLYSRRSVERVRDAIHRFRPHVALVENLFPLHSPWVIRTLRGAGVPVAAGVRSYRMFCASSTLFRDGAPCRDCVGSRLNLPAIRHGCYQGSTVRTAPLATSLAMHRSTFRSVDGYLAVSEFVRDELVDAGYDADRILVRPNFVDDPGVVDGGEGRGFLFAGRLTPEKGVAEMLEAWRRSGLWRRHRLRVAGSGPLSGLVASQDPALRVEPLGLVAHDRLLDAVRDAAVTVVPSLWPEPFGRGVIEAAAHGRAALVCRSGGLPGLVEDGVTGWVAEPDIEALSDGFRRAGDPGAQAAAGRAARKRFEDQYTRAISLDILDRELRRLAAAGVAPTR